MMASRGSTAKVRATQVGTLGLPLLFAYGLLTMPLAMSGLVLLTYLPTFYAIDMGLGLAVVGAAAVLGRLLDVVTDPFIGYLSDQTRTRFGPRKPWMAAGVVGFCLAIWFLLNPPEGAGVLYLVLAGAGYFLFLTLLDVPYSSVGLELSSDTRERTTLASAKAVFQVAGAILAGFFPLILAVPIAGALPSLASTIIALAIAGFLLFVLFIPVPHRNATPPRVGARTAIRFLARHCRFRELLTPFALVQTGNAFFSGLAVLYITFILAAPALVGLLIGLLFLATAALLPVWQFLAARIGKAGAWKVGIMTSCAAFALLPLFGPGDTLAIAILFFAVGSTFGADAVMPTSMLADIAYADEVAQDRRQSGLFLAIKNAASKLAFVVPLAVAFPILDLIGFEARVADDSTVRSIFLLFFAGLPIAFKLSALAALNRSAAFSRSPAEGPWGT